ncbi:peptidyl-prolyl cis-trans isomerase FKBP53-like [Prosopis cineraria]|uniref:peptidyl-prolyl cis-trans isomerase FKBP53-like n=1 Tax=Prosopis cineraria TaxID=364024 RepID=UPI00240F4E87|nr:peptidyl-prolyl cis-trans isomerase FKBP53-like [Prosopis cineraria]
MEPKTTQIRTQGSFVIEEISKGKPDGLWATAGKKVSVRYVGRLRENGKIFYSNIARAPFTFCSGMRIGDKSRITIPPNWGYGDKRADPSIPRDSWLVLDVEMLNVGQCRHVTH